METCAFYSQVFGMVIYLLITLIMKEVKKANNTELELMFLIRGN
jgi:hypothetical protein